MAHTLGVDGIKTFVKKNGFLKKMWENFWEAVANQSR